MPELYQEVAPLRQSAREMVRELGFLQSIYTPAEMPHSHCHTLMELELYGSLNQNKLSERLRLDKSSTSRIINQLVRQELVQVTPDNLDKRCHTLTLTPQGKAQLSQIHRDANLRVQSALAQLSDTERQTVLEGITLYASALTRSRQQSPYELRLIRPEDSPGVAALIRRVMPEFGASGPGFALSDPEVDDMFGTYTLPHSAYFVVVNQERIVGGGGIAPLLGGSPTTCELRKMYFLPEIRGLGLGQKVMTHCLEAAQQHGFTHCYLETLKTMKQAQALYAKNGFQPVDKPMGQTGHFSCDAWYVREL